MIFAWTAAFGIYICAALIVVVLGGYGLTLLATGRTRMLLQFILAVIGLALALLIAIK